MRETFVEVGVLVRSVRAGDYDARIAIFTATGIRWFNVKGVYRPKAKLSAAIGLFTVGEFTICGTTVTAVNVLVSPYEISKEIHRYYLACSIADSLLRLEFVEQNPAALVAAINAYTDLATTQKSCYLIFLDYFGRVYSLLGYETDITYDPEKLTHDTGKKLAKSLADAFLKNVDFVIQFCDMMY